MRYEKYHSEIAAGIVVAAVDAGILKDLHEIPEFFETIFDKVIACENKQSNSFVEAFSND